MSQVSSRCYCAFCRSERVVYRKRHVSLVDVGLTGAASVLLSLMMWQDLDPRAVVFFALGLGLAELFVQLRWRLSIPCPHCGFDPVLYKKSPKVAAEKVKAHLDRRRQDPMFAFAPPPRLPVIVKKADPKAAPQMSGASRPSRSNHANSESRL